MGCRSVCQWNVFIYDTSGKVYADQEDGASEVILKSRKVAEFLLVAVVVDLLAS